MQTLRSTSITLASALALVLAIGSTSPALAAGVTPGQASHVQREQAQSRFLRGKEKFTKADYEGALAEFSASLDIVASPNTRLYVGRSLRELGRIVPAYVEFGRTEVEAKELAHEDPRYEKAGQSAREERLKLEPKLGFVNIDLTHAEPATTVKVNNEEVRPGGWSEPIPVLPGNAEVVVETPNRAPIRRNVEVAATEKKAMVIDAAEAPSTAVAEAPKPAAAPRSSGNGGMRTAAYVTGGAAVVGLGMFVIFGLKANSTYSDLEKACNKAPCPPGHDTEISDGRTQQTMANVGLAVFVIGAAATVTLWVLSTPKSNASTAANSASTTSARVVASPSFFGLQGAF